MSHRKFEFRPIPRLTWSASSCNPTFFLQYDSPWLLQRLLAGADLALAITVFSNTQSA
jgi:hypothetical protein